MRYRGFTFPHNPKRIEIVSVNQEAGLFLPGVGQMRRHMGSRGRRIVGEGCLYGADAPYTCETLMQLQRRGGSGLLHLPGSSPMRAFFTAFTVVCQGDGQVYHYKFEFTEDMGRKGVEDEYSALAVYGYSD